MNVYRLIFFIGKKKLASIAFPLKKTAVRSPESTEQTIMLMLSASAICNLQPVVNGRNCRQQFQFKISR